MYIQLYNILLRKKNINGRCRIHLKRGAEGRGWWFGGSNAPELPQDTTPKIHYGSKSESLKCYIVHCISFPEIEIRNAANLLGKVDLGAVELGLEVVNVSAEEDEGYGEDANENGGGLALGGGSLDDDSILSHNLDALDVVAGVLVGVVLVAEPGLALAGGRVDSLPGLLDLIGILVVVLVVLVLLLVLLGGNALHVNKGLGRVGKLVAAGHLVVEFVVVLNKVGAVLIGEDTHVDLAALVGAVGTHEVLGLLLGLLELTALVVVLVVLVVVVGVLVELDLGAREHIFDLGLFVVVLLVLVLVVGLVGVLLDAVVHAGVHEAVVLAVLLIVGILAAALGIRVVLAVLELVLPVGAEEGVHVDDVVTVGAVAAAGVLVGARAGGAEAEANEALGLDLGLVLVVGILVPLGDVVAALELDGVVGDPGVLDFLVLVVLVELTSLGEDAHAELGFGLDGAGGDVLAGDGDLLGRSNGKGGRDGGESELHLYYY